MLRGTQIFKKPPMEKRYGPRVCLLEFPALGTAYALNFARRWRVFSSVADPLYIISSKAVMKAVSDEKVHFRDIKTSIHRRESIRPAWLSILIQIFKIMVIQVKMSWASLRVSQNVDILVFATGADFILLPLLLAKILKKKTALLVISQTSKSLAVFRPRLLILIYRILERINYTLADQIAVQSESAIGFLGLDRFRDKISVYGAASVDTQLFDIRTGSGQRRNLVGYIGNLAVGKGVMDFLEAIPLILEERADLEFLIGGDGPEYNRIKSRIAEHDLHHKVQITGWLSHDDELPDYLNRLKLLVLPSYSEGLPIIVLEAMACGAIVLATPVGGIPDLIRDEDTGFILENSSPQCIASNVIRALKYPELDVIAGNARKLIEREYVQEVLVEKYRNGLNELVREKSK